MMAPCPIGRAVEKRAKNRTWTTDPSVPMTLLLRRYSPSMLATFSEWPDRGPSVSIVAVPELLVGISVQRAVLSVRSPLEVVAQRQRAAACRGAAAPARRVTTTIGDVAARAVGASEPLLPAVRCAVSGSHRAAAAGALPPVPLPASACDCPDVQAADVRLAASAAKESSRRG